VAETTVWNALGQAVAGGSSSANWSSVFDPSGQWIGQYKSAGYWWGEYVRLGGRVLAFNSQSQGITVFLHKDMQTTTHMATGPSGSVLQDQVFYPWGQSWYNLGTWYQQEWAGLDGEDPSTGFYGSLSRAYNPSPGRWLTPDPAGWLAQGETLRLWHRRASIGAGAEMVFNLCG
jgi:RHS repeat-associated protein